MSTVVFRRELDPGPPGFRDYDVDPSTLSFVWQYRAPRVEPGIICKEPTHEGIIFGTAPEAEYQLSPDDVPPSPQGFYCAGRMWIENQLQWVLRRLPEGSGEAETRTAREDAHSVTVFDEPTAARVDVGWSVLAIKATAESLKGRSILGYARQHWRTRHAWRPIGCLVAETEYLFSSTSVSGPAYVYSSITIDKGTHEIDGELAGIGYTSSIGSDLVQYRAMLLIRKLKTANPNPTPENQKQQTGFQGGMGIKSTNESTGGGGGLFLLGGAALAAYLFLGKKGK